MARRGPARDGRPFNPEHFWREFVTRCERYGVPRIELHDLRHTHATLALQRRCTLGSCRSGSGTRRTP